MKRNFSEIICMHSVPDHRSLGLICSALKDGAELILERLSSGEQEVVFKNGEFSMKETNQLLSKEQFLRSVANIPGDPNSLVLRRADFIPEFQSLSDNEVARRLGDTSLTRVMHEIAEEGKDIWG